MGLLQPWLMALGVAVAVPLLLHLLQRHQGPRVVFPAVRYLRRAERESARRIRLRQWLLLLLRAAAVLLAALAAARPFLAGAGAAHEPSAVVIVLDNSLSTSAVAGERRVFDGLRARALQTLAAAGPDDRFWLVRAGSPQEAAAGGDANTVAALVRATRPTAAAADLSAALARARAILATSAGGRAPEIHLLSDLQASELRRLGAEGEPPPLLVWVEPEAPPANHAISRVAVAGGLAPLAGTRTQLVATTTGSRADSVTLRLFLDERLAAATTAPVGAAAALALPALPPGVVRGRVETDPDALQADDRRYFVTRVVPPPIVAAPGASAFLRDALAVMADAGRLRPGSATDADVILLSGNQPLPPLERGTVLVVLAPATDVELPALNGQLQRLGVPWGYGPAVAGREVTLSSPDTTDPLLRTLEQARLTRTYPLLARAGAQADSVLLRTANGTPWAVRGTLSGGGRYVLLGSPLDPESSSIPTSAAMIPLLASILGAWAGVGEGRLDAEIGNEVRLPAGTVSVLRPDGIEERVQGDYLVPALIGIYQVRSADSLVSAFAVNPPAAESELARVGRRDLDRVFPGWQVRSADDPDGWRSGVFRARLGAELWRPALLALLALLLIEALLAASGASRRTAQPTEAMAKD